MAGLGPFEAHCTLAVAVSGGADSMALAWLARRWALVRGGSILGLIVDHRLRSGSAEEAVQVRNWLEHLEIPALILARTGPRPASGLQRIAREDRYALLLEACRTRAILHLLLGHHRGDQRETQAMRARREGTGEGLAGMAAVREVSGLRLLRPLLGFAPDRLRATLVAIGQEWVEDPSNADERFERVRVRRGLEGLDGATTPTAGTALESRRARERTRARALAAHVRPHPWGYVEIDLARSGDSLPQGPLADLLRRCLWTVSGEPYPPPARAVEAIAREIAAGQLRGRTLAGCILRPRPGRILVAREPRAAAGAPRAPSLVDLWDGRFTIDTRGLPAGATIGALGRSDATDLRQRLIAAKLHRQVPAIVLATLPAARVDGELVAIAFVGEQVGLAQLGACWTPRQVLAGAIF